MKNPTIWHKKKVARVAKTQNKHTRKALPNNETIAPLEVIWDRWTLLRHTSEALRNKDYAIAVAAAIRDILILRQASSELLDNEAFIHAMLTQDPFSLKYASYRLRNHPAIVMAALTRNAHALQYADRELRDSHAFMLAAVTQNGLAIQFAHKELRNDEAIALAAVTQNGTALFHIDRRLWNNKTIVLAAIEKDVSAIQWADQSLFKDDDFLRSISDNDGVTNWIEKHGNPFMKSQLEAIYSYKNTPVLK